MADWDNEKATYRTLGTSLIAYVILSRLFTGVRLTVRDAPTEGVPEDGRQG